MAHDPKKRSRPTGAPGARPTGKQGARPAGSPPDRPAAGDTAGRARQSVAAARLDNSRTNNKTQFLLLGAAALVIVGIVIFGFVRNAQNNKVPESGYGKSTATVATVAGGVVTATNGTTPPVMLDFYQDALCPVCAAFEQKYGQQINKALDAGKIGIRYHMLDFLNQNSASKTYSTRAAAALLCVATQDGTAKGVFVGVLEALYASDTQPTEGGATDLSDEQLAAVATAHGASAAAAGCITSGAQLATAKTETAAGNVELNAAATAAGVQAGTPAVLRDGKYVDIDDTNWLSSIAP